VSPKRIRIIVAAVLVAAMVTAVIVVRDRRAAADGIVASGTVEATTADLGFAAGGRIEAVLVREGDAVAAGQVLARLERSELDARRRLAEAQIGAAAAQRDEARQGPRGEEIAQARAAVAAAASRLEDARRDVERAQRLFDGGAISREAIDKTLTQAAVAEAQHAQVRAQLRALERGTRAERIVAADAQLAQAEAGLAQVDALYANAEARASFDGLVSVRHREPGETVAPGAPVVSLLDMSDRWVRIYVRATDVARIAVGQEARIVAGRDAVEYRGVVAHIASEAEFTPRNVQTPDERSKLVYAVRVRITGDPDGRLKPGLPVDVVLTPESVP
jgi:HlyD family secretion protein